MLERRLQRGRAMSLARAARVATCTCLLFGCSRVQAPPVVSPPAPVTADYVTIHPDVSVSRTAQAAEEKQASLDPHADVMAEILAIPPGR